MRRPRQLRYRHILRSLADEETGATVLIVASSLLVLLLFAGLATDLPIALGERRTAQNAADNAALAAAYASCTGADQATAITAGETSATTNGYTDGVANALVSVTAGTGTNEFTVTIDSSSSAFFARVIGIDDFGIGVTATAECEQALQDAYALFGIGNCGSDDTIQVSGSDFTVIGASHSNGNVYVSGSDVDFNGLTTVFDVVEGGGSNVTYTPPALEGQPARPDPFAGKYTIADFAPGGTIANQFAAQGRYVHNGSNDKLEIKNPQDGYLYYSDGKDGIVLDPDNANITRSITLVSENQIDFKTKSNSTWNPAHDDLIAYSAYDQDPCSSHAIQMSDQGTTWNGIFYAPEGMITMPGSNGGTLSGSLVGWKVKLNGQNLTIQAPAGASTGDPVSKITQ